MNLALTLAATLALALTAYGQGTLFFSNLVRPEIDAPITDGLTGCGLHGTNFWAQLLVGFPGEGVLKPVGNPLPFRSGRAAGYVDTAAGDSDIIVPGFAGGTTVDVQVRVFFVPPGRVPSPEAALFGAFAYSEKFQITLGGGLFPPANLVGLKPFSLTWLGYGPDVLRFGPSRQVVLVGTDVTLTIDDNPAHYDSGFIGVSPRPYVEYYTNVYAGYYKWQMLIGETNWVTISEGPTNTLHLSSVSKEASGQYRAVLGQACGRDFSIPWPGSSGVIVNVIDQPRLIANRIQSSSGTFEFNLSGDAGINYRVETSTNLTEWTAFQTFTNFTGSAAVKGDTSIQANARFYRASAFP